MVVALFKGRNVYRDWVGQGGVFLAQGIHLRTSEARGGEKWVVVFETRDGTWTKGGVSIPQIGITA